MLFVKSPFIIGHRNLPWGKKACPCFDVRKWLKDIHFSIST